PGRHDRGGDPGCLAHLLPLVSLATRTRSFWSSQATRVASVSGKLRPGKPAGQHPVWVMLGESDANPVKAAESHGERHWRSPLVDSILAERRLGPSGDECGL